MQESLVYFPRNCCQEQEWTGLLFVLISDSPSDVFYLQGHTKPQNAVCVGMRPYSYPSDGLIRFFLK